MYGATLQKTKKKENDLQFSYADGWTTPECCAEDMSSK